MIQIEYDDREVVAALKRLEANTGNLAPALKDIGEEMIESTKQRFKDKKGPDGEAWPLNTPTTIERKGHDDVLIGGNLHEDGVSFSKGGTLGEQIFYQLVGDDALEWGSPLEYAAMQQFGGTQAEFPFLWGDIPERPYLGISAEDEKAILEIVEDHLLNP